MNIKLRFQKAVDDMVAVNHYLAAEVCKLGYPMLSDKIPTAGVGWDGERKKIIFLFNPKFAEILNDEEFCFVVGHESIHLLNSHVFLLYDEIEKLKKMQKSISDINEWKRKMNIAMDCVVNDSLVNLYDLPKVLTEDPKISGKVKIWYGKETVGTECHDMTAQEVYYLLPEEVTNPQPQTGDVENHEMWDSFFNSDGTINRDFVDAVKEFIEKNIQNSVLSDDEAEKIDEMKKSMEDCTDAYASKAGTAAVGLRRPIDGLSRETLNWNKILYKLVDILKTEDIWTKPNRKLIPVYPDIILPSWKDQEKEKIFCAIDASGSISQDALRLFVSVLRNTPKRFEIKAMSFDTKCYPYNIKSKDEPLGGGGTYFDIIEQYILDNFKKYPKAVFILTDGLGTPVVPKHPDRWAWLLYGPCSTTYCKDMKNYKIMDLLDKNAKV